MGISESLAAGQRFEAISSRVNRTFLISPAGDCAECNRFEMDRENSRETAKRKLGTHRAAAIARDGPGD
jgi:hypothetical protein